MSRKRIIAANWKLNHLNIKDVSDYFEAWNSLDLNHNSEIVVFPPNYALLKALELSGSKTEIGIQNIHFETKGAFTGENSVSSARDIGCKWVLIGHSERRQYFGESDENCLRKIELCKEFEIKPMYCIGETLEEREAGATEAVVSRQLFCGLPSEPVKDLAIAYEPVWAIGTGKVASPEDAQQVHLKIREVLKNKYNEEIAQNTAILYGGSVKPENAEAILSQKDIDGALVGGASLKPDSFHKILQS